MNELIIGNNISQLTLDNEEIFNAIWKSLRFRDKNYFHSPAYKLFTRTRGKMGWDGHVAFFSKDTGKFGTGLLPEVVMALGRLKIWPQLIDNRAEEIEAEEIFPNMMSEYQDRFGNPMMLYDYQCEIGNKAWKMERGIIEAATAAGKTLMFTAMLKSIPVGTPTLVLFRSKTLVNQTVAEFKRYGLENVGVIHGESFDPNILMCATIQSAHNYLDLLPKFKVLIADECHEFATEKSIKVFKKLENCRYRFGFSATPWNVGDNIKKYRLKSWFGPIIGKIQTKELQEMTNFYGEPILSKSICYFHEISSPVLDVDNYQDAYNLGVVYNQHLHEKVKEIVASYENGRIVIVVERLEHGTELARSIPGSYWVSGQDDEEIRTHVIGKLQKSEVGEKVTAIATKIMQTGVNLFVHGIVNAAGMKSYIATKQRIGRGLRPALDKDHLDYHDFYFTNNEYLERHSKERIKWLKREGHKIIYVNSDGKQTELT
jgi:superfamily II DNA or RNA helicase